MNLIYYRLFVADLTFCNCTAVVFSVNIIILITLVRLGSGEVRQDVTREKSEIFRRNKINV